MHENQNSHICHSLWMQGSLKDYQHQGDCKIFYPESVCLDLIILLLHFVWSFKITQIFKGNSCLLLHFDLYHIFIAVSCCFKKAMVHARGGWWRKQSRAAQGTHNSFSTSVHTFQIVIHSYMTMMEIFAITRCQKEGFKKGQGTICTKDRKWSIRKFSPSTMFCV